MMGWVKADHNENERTTGMQKFNDPIEGFLKGAATESKETDTAQQVDRPPAPWAWRVLRKSADLGGATRRALGGSPRPPASDKDIVRNMEMVEKFKMWVMVALILLFLLPELARRLLAAW